MAALFSRIPGITSEQLGWCATWLRSAVAHWLHLDMLHGNEVTPILIGQQGCGKSQADRPRYASFLATTNDEHPLCDPTGSRRFICIRIRAGAYIDNASPIDYAQLYAQVMYELKEQSVPYWFTNDMVARIQKCNYPYFKTDDMEVMLKACFQAPQGDGGKWMLVSEIFDSLHRLYQIGRAHV